MFTATERIRLICVYMAEREGFEPSIRVNVYTLSRRAPSAARPPLQFIDAKGIMPCNKNQLNFNYTSV